MKKPTWAEYPDWFRGKFQLHLDDQRFEYEDNARAAHEAFVVSPFWRDVRAQAQIAHRRYQRSNVQFDLLPSFGVPDLPPPKEWASFVKKTYRRNVLDNDNWPDPPTCWLGDGWIEPRNWFERINDIVRTSIIVRYMDGIAEVERLLVEVAELQSTTVSGHYHAWDTGYFAYHATVAFPVALRVLGRLETIGVPIEIQVRTEAQYSIQQLTHSFYEEVRVSDIDDGAVPWQWCFRDPNFTPNFMGHTIQFLDGVMQAAKDGKVAQHG